MNVLILQQVMILMMIGTEYVIMHYIIILKGKLTYGMV